MSLIFLPTKPTEDLLQSRNELSVTKSALMYNKIVSNLRSENYEDAKGANQELLALGIELPSVPPGGITKDTAIAFIQNRKFNLRCTIGPNNLQKSCLHSEDFSRADIDVLTTHALGGFRAYIGINSEHPSGTNPMCIIIVCLDATGKEIVTDSIIREFGSPCPPNCPDGGGRIVGIE